MSAKPDALLTLIAGGQSHARIVVAVDAPPVEAHADEELQRYLRAMSGSEVTLIHEAHPRLANLLIGAAAVARYPDLKDLVLGIDGYVVERRGNDLLLAGRRPYSALYAVYHLLERHLGWGSRRRGLRLRGAGSSLSPAVRSRGRDGQRRGPGGGGLGCRSPRMEESDHESG